MNTLVFLGPTLDRAEACRLADATFRPPVEVGDVYRAVRDGFDVLLIVDGHFQRVPAVWHKEILFALSEDVAVLGCSSMGALRAAELHRYGMVGIGEVFELFREGILVDDDEVAVTHGTAETGFRRASEAMVDIRFALRDAARQGIVAGATRDWMTAYAKRLFYPERHWATICDAALRDGLPPAEVRSLAAWVCAAAPSVKARDAVLALRHVADGRAVRGRTGTVPFEPTNLWSWLEAAEGRTGLAIDAAQD